MTHHGSDRPGPEGGAGDSNGKRRRRRGGRGRRGKPRGDAPPSATPSSAPPPSWLDDLDDLDAADSAYDAAMSGRGARSRPEPSPTPPAAPRRDQRPPESRGRDSAPREHSHRETSARPERPRVSPPRSAPLAESHGSEGSPQAKRPRRRRRGGRAAHDDAAPTQIPPRQASPQVDLDRHDDFDEGESHEARDHREHSPRRTQRTEKTYTGGFSKLGLSTAMMDALADAGYEEPTPIQAGLIPRAMANVDVLGQARTGTGKTAAFVIPILERLEPHHAHATPQALVLVPTRELAVQVKDEFEKLARGTRSHILAVYGGKPIRQQVEKLRRGAEVVVGTPGRVMDHMARGTLQLGGLKLVVLDEADRMLDIGFRPDIEKILRQCPQSRQTLLLSATVPPPVEKLAKRYMRDPETQNFSPTDVSADTIDQYYFTVDADKKFELLLRLLKREDPRQSIIFCRTKRGTEKIHHNLQRKIADTACIHGDLAQSARDRVMRAFRDGQVRHLVATDVVGRGIDVTNISHIINYDVPAFCDDYVHRVGRTGRMGREGVAYTFVTPEEGGELTRIEIRIEKLLKRDEIEGFEASKKRGTSDAEGALAAAAAGSTKYITNDTGATAEADAASPAKGPPKKKYRRAL